MTIHEHCGGATRSPVQRPIQAKPQLATETGVYRSGGGDMPDQRWRTYSPVLDETSYKLVMAADETSQHLEPR